MTRKTSPLAVSFPRMTTQRSSNWRPVWDCLAKHVDDNPTSANPQIRTKVRQLQAIFKANPDAANIMNEAMKKTGTPPILDREQMKKRNRDFVAEINLLMQNWRVLCVSTLNNSEEMWVRYADGHQGIVLRIVPNLEKDRKFQRFAPVVYRESGPRFMKAQLAFKRTACSATSRRDLRNHWTRSSILRRWIGKTRMNTVWRFRSGTENETGIHFHTILMKLANFILVSK